MAAATGTCTGRLTPADVVSVRASKPKRGKSRGMRFPELLHARWSTNHREALQPMSPDDLRAHFAAQASTEIPSWFQPAMDHLSVPSLPERTSNDKQDNAAVKSGPKKRIKSVSTCGADSRSW